MTNLGLLKRFKVSCQSALPDATFTLDTNPLHPDNLPKFKAWEEHGFIVLELEPGWERDRYDYDRWVNTLINRTLERIVTISEHRGVQDQMAGYDAELKQAVLEHLNAIAPDATNNMELKHAMQSESSDDALLRVLDILLLDGQISGVGLWENQSGSKKLSTIGNVKISAEGRRVLTGQNRPVEPTPAVHQYINHGQAGAMGPNSIGTINYQQQWSKVENQTNLTAIASEFEQAIKDRASSAASSADFAELQLMAQAKEQAQKHEGSKLLETVTTMGKTALPILASAGAHGLVSMLEHKLGIKLS